MTDVPVTGQAPLGRLSVGEFGPHLLVWECALCFSLICDISGHSRKCPGKD